MVAVTDSDEQSQSNHLNTFWSPFNNESGDTLESKIATADELGGISHINHLGRYTGARSVSLEEGQKISTDPVVVGKYVDLFTKYDSVVGMEIINKKDGDSISDRILWDSILQQTTENRRPVLGFSNDVYLFKITTNVIQNSLNVLKVTVSTSYSQTIVPDSSVREIVAPTLPIAITLPYGDDWILRSHQFKKNCCA